MIGGPFPGYLSPNPDSPYEGLDLNTFRELYTRTPLAAPVGEKWIYSNVGMGLLGLILSEKTGFSYEDMVVNRIFRPLGMNDSYFEVPKSALSRFPSGIVNGKPYPHWDLYDTGISAAGGIRSTISDMVKYARANLVSESTALRPAVELARLPRSTIFGSP